MTGLENVEVITYISTSEKALLMILHMKILHAKKYQTRKVYAETQHTAATTTPTT